MTTYRIFSRSFAALSMTFTLATGVALMVAPSAARAESAVFGAFDDDSDDVGFMDYTDDACLPSATGRQAGAEACAAPARAIQNTSGTTVRVPTIGAPVPAGGTTNIIMKDGNICDPIRHMGC